MQDEDKITIQALYAFVIVALVGSILVLGFSLIQSGGSFNSYVVSGLVGTVTCVIVLVLLLAKRFLISRLIFPLAVYLLATYLIFTGATVGIRDDAVLLFSLVVAMAGLLLGKRGVIVFALLSMSTVGGSVYAEINGILVNHITERTTTYVTLLSVFVMYGLTFGMMYMLVAILTSNLAKMRSNQRELTQANQELLSIRESLEQQVTERLRAADLARAEAESARRDAESQTWFIRGQAQLAEKMRGDQSLEMLANNVIDHLCHYLGAHTGAFFFLSNNKLKLTGRYAYEPSGTRKEEFALDENLVGESARSNRIILVEDVPADAPLIASALGSTPPRQILIAPIEIDNQVFGAVELATLDRFTADHETFLRQASENIAVALRTAQAHAQINDLLSQAQRQAEELQVQQEELRAVNEELQAQAENQKPFMDPRR
jgi:putative methionine-R-sulfoxide reductase with GAF domain